MAENNSIKPYTNIILICIIIISIYILYNDYKYECENSDKFILDYKDFEKNMDRYSNSNIYNLYSNMSEEDKQFINDYIIYTRTKYKKEKPVFHNKLKKIRNQVVLASIASVLLAKTSMGIFASLKQNYIQYFLVSGVI
jgi:hypothetical protein